MNHKETEHGAMVWVEYEDGQSCWEILADVAPVTHNSRQAEKLRERVLDGRRDLEAKLVHQAKSHVRFL
jgi:hypothetical protein